MENVEYLKTLCPACDGSIEFPADAIGQTTDCPHCHKAIVLGSVAARAQPPEIPSVLRQQPAASPTIRREKSPEAFLSGKLGCAFYMAYCSMGIVQMFAIFSCMKMGVGLIMLIIAWPVALFLAMLPIVGTVLGIIGAAKAWGWSWSAAILLFVGPWFLWLLGSMCFAIAEFKKAPLQECSGSFSLSKSKANLAKRTQKSVFIEPNANLRRVFAWAGERRGRAPEPQFAAPPVATRNGLTQPTRIGAFTASEEHLAKAERSSKAIPSVF